MVHRGVVWAQSVITKLLMKTVRLLDLKNDENLHSQLLFMDPEETDEERDLRKKGIQSTIDESFVDGRVRRIVVHLQRSLDAHMRP